MLIFEHKPNKYTIFFADAFYPAIIDMNDRFPLSKLVNDDEIMPTKRGYYRQGLQPLEWYEIPSDVKKILVSAMSIMLEDMVTIEDC